MNLTKNKPLLASLAVIILGFFAWLVFGFFGIQTAFIDDEVSEAGPVFSATVAEQDDVVATEEFQEAMVEAEANQTESDEASEAAMLEEEMPNEIVTLVRGQFAGTSRYDVNGDALVLNDGSEQRFLRFESFESSNGPDLKVYLRAESGDYVNLGELKGNIGEQNYEIPPDVDLSVFATVQIWCERFGVEFGNATLV